MATGLSGGMYLTLIPVLVLAVFLIFFLRPFSRGHALGRKSLRYTAASLAMAIATACLVAMGGCGYNSNTANGTRRGTTTIMVTATSGSLSHTTSVSLTVQ
jgi:hypothetical protein